jgi:hypothetical protein
MKLLLVRILGNMLTAFAIGLAIVTLLAGIRGAFASAGPGPALPDPALPEPRTVYEGELPDGRAIVFLVDCPSLFDASQALIHTLAGIAADSTSECDHDEMARAALEVEMDLEEVK